MAVRRHPAEPRANPSRAEAIRARGLEAFGRAGAQAQGLVPTDLGCPDCRGVLYVAELGEHGFLSFRCRVGHVFSADVLLELKEDRLDDALWMALELLEELVQLYTVLDARSSRTARGSRAAHSDQRIRRALKHRRALRALIRVEGSVPRVRQKGQALA